MPEILEENIQNAATVFYINDAAGQLTQPKLLFLPLRRKGHFAFDTAEF